MRRLTLLLLALGLAVALAAGPAAAAGEKTWRVTIENLTSAQPFSPPLLVVHTNRADVWSVGEPASAGVAGLAEDGSNAVLQSALTGAPGVASALTGAGGALGPGATRTYDVTSRGAFDRLSLLTMLVNTNDGFTGLDSLHLRGRGTTVYAMVYDAGSEVNNELTAFIPGPCCGNPFVRDPEGSPIAMHPGILGIGDLDPDTYGWEGAVAMITIERVS